MAHQPLSTLCFFPTSDPADTPFLIVEAPFGQSQVQGRGGQVKVTNLDLPSGT